MNEQTDRPAEDSLTVPLTCTLFGAEVRLGLFDRALDDGSWLFFGYKNKNDPHIRIAGQDVSLQLEILPDGTPERTNPYLDTRTPGQNSVTWYENAMVTLSAAFVFLREFEEKRGFLLDGSLNTEIEKYYNHIDFQAQLELFSAVSRDKNLRFGQKVLKLAPVLTSLRRILELNRIPDHLKYEESVFYLNLLRLREHVLMLIEETGRTDEDIIPDFRLIAEHLADVIREIEDDHENLARGRLPSPVPEERDSILATLDELAHIHALEKDSPAARQATGRLLALCRAIWENPAIDWQTRLDAATEAVEILSTAISAVETAAAESAARHATIPRLQDYLDEAGAQLRELDENGFAAITGPLADRFLTSTNEARKAIGLVDPVTKEGLAAAIRLNAVLVSIAETGGQLETSLHLYLTDSDYAFAVQYMYALVRNGKIREMKLLGR